MTAYFDDIQRTVAELSAQSNEEFLKDVLVLEEEVLRTVSLCTGDREFPEEHREYIQGTIAMKSLKHGSEKVKGYLWTIRAHGLFAALHGQFHTLAGYRIKTRFGFLTDDPAANVRARDRHDAGEADDAIPLREYQQETVDAALAAGDSRKEDAMPRMHPRVQVVNEAECKLREALSEIRKDLTEPEYLKVVANILGDEVGTIAKYAIRQERHGRTDKPGDWE